MKGAFQRDLFGRSAASAIALSVVLGLAASAAPAVARPLELGGWLGPRFFSDNSRLGRRGVDDPSTLTNALVIGGRVGWPLLEGQLIPELELALTSTDTDPFNVGVVWIEPRVALRYQWMRHRWLRPFVLVGAGSPISLSGNRDVFATQILGEGFVGAGVSLWTGKGFTLRFDARLAMLPGRDPKVTVEGELGVGVTIPFGAGRRVAAVRVAPPPPDRDGDGVADAVDACVDRAEDRDGFQDEDGCPDIDNDGDVVLDIVDACPLEPETYNGITDDDGCPDVLPPELAALGGPIEAATFAAGAVSPGRTGALTATFDRIASALQASPAVRVRIIGHADDQEAGLGAPGPDGELPDPAALAVELGLQRATMARELLVIRGIAEERILVDSRGADEPKNDDPTPAGRQANRRIELELVVPVR